MGGCCSREQTQENELLNIINYTAEDIINIGRDSGEKPELKYETIKLVKTPEEIQLDLIIDNIQKLFRDKTKKISKIELYNLAIYFKDNHTESEYLLYDTRRSAEQKEDFLKKMNHINYTYAQIKSITGKKRENFQYFLNNKIIIFIISERFLNKDYKSKVTPIEIINLLFNINNNMNIYLLDSSLNEPEISNIFIKLINFLGDKSYEKLPYILFCYKHVTTFYIEGYIFINFFNTNIFSFESLINEMREENTEYNFENRFLIEMNINTIINIDNTSKTDYNIKENQYKKNIYKNISLTKLSLLKNKKDIMDVCVYLRSEISKGHCIYINIENYNETINDWIFVIIVILTYVIGVNYIEIINYLNAKINFIPNFSQSIISFLNCNEFDDFFDN
jgi:hypothetical protein